jgi:hypothetical protein
MNIIPFLSAISGESLMNLVIWLVILGVIYWVVQVCLSKVPMDETIKTVIHVVLLIGITILLINALLSLVGKPFIQW